MVSPITLLAVLCLVFAAQTDANVVDYKDLARKVLLKLNDVPATNFQNLSASVFGFEAGTWKRYYFNVTNVTLEAKDFSKDFEVLGASSPTVDSHKIQVLVNLTSNANLTAVVKVEAHYPTGALIVGNFLTIATPTDDFSVSMTLLLNTKDSKVSCLNVNVIPIDFDTKIRCCSDANKYTLQESMNKEGWRKGLKGLQQKLKVAIDKISL